ncbi:hypothetical protein MRY87_09160 [bacterium]|nr:hypothetical protein [bacterium]
MKQSFFTSRQNRYSRFITSSTAPFLVATGLLIAITPGTAFAKPTTLTVTDCDGATRLSQELRTGQEARVIVKLAPSSTAPSSAATERQVFLVPAGVPSGTAVRERTTTSQEVTFGEVPEGTWKVCGPENTQIAVEEVTVSSGTETTRFGGSEPQQNGSSLQNAGIIGASLASVGALAVSLGDSSGGGDTPASANSIRENTNPFQGGNLNVPQERDRGNNNVTVNNFDDDDFSFGAKGAPVSPFE